MMPPSFTRAPLRRDEFVPTRVALYARHGDFFCVACALAPQRSMPPAAIDDRFREWSCRAPEIISAPTYISEMFFADYLFHL